jgi:hypothetical protein
MEDLSTPTNTPQKFGYGTEQAAEFMLPGGAEKEAIAKLGTMTPKAMPLIKAGVSGLSTGAMNKLQGGEFGTGAALGAAGSAIGQGLKAVAPAVAEKALGIRGKFDRAYNKTPGLAALTETTGIRPETVSAQAGKRIGELSEATNRMADAASIRPNPVRGLLAPPPQEIPLHTAGGYEGRLSQPVRLTEPNRPGRPLLPAPSLSTPMAPGMQSEFPERLASGDTSIRPDISSPHGGMGQAQYIGEIPGERGGPGQVQGVLIRPGETQAGALPPTVPNRMASLAHARQPVSEAMGKAVRENAAGTHGQLEGMQNFLGRRFATGEPIPETVTPRELLDLRRGFNEEHGRWNPELHDTTVATGRRAYGGLTGEFHRVLPEAEPLDTRVANLIPVKNRAQIVALHDNIPQRMMGRIGAHTGALSGMLAGGYEGRREGGTPGMIAGGLAGLAIPELVSSPEGQMALARTLYKANALRPLTGAALQFDRNREPKP